MQNLNDIDLNGKKVLIRADLNVPYSGAEITNTKRIREFLPTLKHVIEAKGHPVVMSHLGRPKGTGFEEEFSMGKVADKLAELSGYSVNLIDHDETADFVNYQVNLLENLRFNAGEKAGDSEFAKKIAQHGEIFINDAFGTAHRAHASMKAVAELFKIKAPGFLMQKELDYFQKALKAPERPLAVILGGAKISDKLPVLENLANIADVIVVGGAMANTFLAAEGKEVGTSLYEEEMFDKVSALQAKLKTNNCQLVLPTDFKVAADFNAATASGTCDEDNIPADQMTLDIGPESSKKIAEALSDCKTIVWNGPMGKFETPAFAEATLELAKTIGKTSALSIVGGGDTVAAVEEMGLADQFDFLSTGGGAFMELLKGSELPGIVALES